MKNKRLRNYKKPERMYKLYNKLYRRFHKKRHSNGYLYKQLKWCADVADQRNLEDYEIVCYELVEVHRVPLLEYLRNKEAGNKII